MNRKIVHIDESKCDGCGLCVPSCAEGAIRIIDGKAKLVSDMYCDGLGACLGECPQNAITIIEREAEAFDEEKALAHVAEQKQAHPAKAACPSGGCPGSMARALTPKPKDMAEHACAAPSQLMNWPVQLTLVPPGAPYLRGADILLAADCAPFAYAAFHRDFLDSRPVLIACPKLDDAGAHAVKLAEVLKTAAPASVTVVRMEVPCCGGLTRIAEEALRLSGCGIPVREVVLGIDGSRKGERAVAD